MVRQSTKMNRIQSTVSGGFDAIGGQDILDAIQGLMRSHEELSRGAGETGWRFSPFPDVRDDTVARFAARRFRTTCHSIRPLLEDDNATDVLEEAVSEAPPVSLRQPHCSQRELDQDAHAFALSLIERWVADPSNVRLLLIGLDLWPDVEVLKAVVDLLRPFTEKGGRPTAPRRVAWYCLAEILRPGVTETGLVDDAESLPRAIDLDEYRGFLRDEAARLISYRPLRGR